MPVKARPPSSSGVTAAPRKVSSFASSLARGERISTPTLARCARCPCGRGLLLRGSAAAIGDNRPSQADMMRLAEVAAIAASRD